MATIVLYAGKINQMPGLINELKNSVSEYNSELFSLKSVTLNINKSVCDLEDVISSIQSSTQIQEQKIASLDTFNQSIENFIADVVRIDSDVAAVINQRKANFYDAYSYLKPECEKNGWENFCADMASASEWCKENWEQIKLALKAIVIVAVVAVAIVCICTPGLNAIVIGMAWGALIGTGVGGLLGGLTSLATGGSLLEGVINGAFSGAITGAIFGGISGAGQIFAGFLGASPAIIAALGGSVKVSAAIKGTFLVSTTLSLSMLGLDVVSLVDMLIIPSSNPIADFNNELNSNKLYSFSRTFIGVLSAFTGGLYKGFKPTVKETSGNNITIGDDFEAPKVYKNSNGELTNGTYTVSDAKMQSHLNGQQGKSQFMFSVDAEKAVLDAAAYADSNSLWTSSGSGFASKAKVPVIDGYVGVTGSGEPSTYVNVYRTSTGYVHGCPGNP